MGAEKCKFIKNKVSVVTPVFNGESHLERMLDSILGQTYQELEMILVDDGSTDNTALVAEGCQKKFEDKGLEFRIIKAEHRNASAAINQGLPYVTGEYLVWPDSDDILEPDSIGKRVAFLQTHPQYQCVRTLAYYFDAVSGKMAAADEKTGDLKKEKLFWDILESKTFVCCGCYMVKSESFFEIYPERRIPEYDVGQNFQMLLPFMYFHKCPTIQEKLYGVYVRKGSHSRRVLTQKEEEKKYQDYEELVDRIAEICDLQEPMELKRIAGWKIRRRYQLALKYGYMKRVAGSLRQLYRNGDIGIIHMVKGNVRAYLHFYIRKLKDAEWKQYKKRKFSRLKNKDFTVIASNCSGTMMYYDLGLPFLSPTINLTIGMNDFVRMVENLKWYMGQEIAESKDENGHPAGLLGDIKINFIHYTTFEEAIQKWNERKNRINWDNLFIIGMERGDCSYETMKRFNQLPYKNKVLFTHVEYPEFQSAYYIKGFEEQSELGTITNFKNHFWRRRYLDDFDYVKFFNRTNEERG